MKARFAKEALGLSRLSFLQGDVCALSREQHGDFDIVICSGILYHLNAPDVFHFVKRIAEVCQGFVIIDTFVSLKDEVSLEFEGRTYWGRYCPEPNTDKIQRMKALWSSMDNVQSFWLTRPSPFNLLEHVGFTSVLECCVPSMLNVSLDRVTFVAVKNNRVPILSSPPTDSLETEAWPEHRPFEVHAIQDRKSIAFQRIKSLLPNVIKVPLKNVCDMLKRKSTAKTRRTPGMNPTLDAPVNSPAPWPARKGLDWNRLSGQLLPSRHLDSPPDYLSLNVSRLPV